MNHHYIVHSALRMQLPALSLLPVSVRDSRGKCDYAMVYPMGTSSGGYLTLASYRVIAKNIYL